MPSRSRYSSPVQIKAMAHHTFPFHLTTSISIGVASYGTLGHVPPPRLTTL